ncbi:MAG: S8 family serine peptidase [Deinococcales bacterium]
MASWRGWRLRTAPLPARYYLAITGNADESYTGNHNQKGRYRLKLSTSPLGTARLYGQVQLENQLTTLSLSALAELLAIPLEATFKADELLVSLNKGLHPQQLLFDEAKLESLLAQESIYRLSLTDLKPSISPSFLSLKEDSPQLRDFLARLYDLRQQPEFSSVCPNYLRFAQSTPNDPRFADQWHLQEAGFETAWDLSTGSSDVIIAILDSGITPNHPDLTCGRSAQGYDFIDNDTFPFDEGPQSQSSYHGTHVAGIAGACTDNALGVSGVDWQAKLAHLRVLGPYGALDSDIARAILWASGYQVSGLALNSNPADVINMSLGGFGESPILQEAVNMALAKGVNVVVAAGNFNSDARSFVPSGLRGVISVGALAREGDLASYSNYGPAISLMAAGGSRRGQIQDDILSTLALEDGRALKLDYGYFSGTSMASPQVAGTIALMKALKPDLDPPHVERYLSQSAQPLSGSRCQQLGCGAGALNPTAALSLVQTEAPIAAYLQAPSKIDLSSATSFSLSNLGDRATSFSLSSSHPQLSLTANKISLPQVKALRLS